METTEERVRELVDPLLEPVESEEQNITKSDQRSLRDNTRVPEGRRERKWGKYNAG